MQDDTISRKAAIHAMQQSILLPARSASWAVYCLEKLPPADKPKTRIRTIKGALGQVISMECEACSCTSISERFNFCPMCGAEIDRT